MTISSGYCVLIVILIILIPQCYLNVCVHAARSKSMVLGELSRLSRPCSPQDQEKPLKAGWLKRQRSIMKNWQLRWFVLRSEALYFHKDQDESKAQVIIPTTKNSHTVGTNMMHTTIKVPFFSKMLRVPHRLS